MFTKLIHTLLFATAFIACNIAGAQLSANAPNIIIIYVDDMGYGDVSSYGSEISTPNIDALGRQGIRFTDFYVAAPVCTPSRYSLLTGLYPQRSLHGLTNALMPMDNNYLDTTEHTLATFLKTKNYHTALIGKWHLGRPDSATTPVQYGFEHFTGILGGCIDYFRHEYGSLEKDWYINNQPATEQGYSTDLLTSHAIDYIKMQKRQPFFLYLAYNAPHYGKTDTAHFTNYTLPLAKVNYKGFTDYNTLQVPQKYLQKCAFIKNEYRRTYAAMVSNLDDNIGRLLRYLEKTNRLNNTLIWLISDNGGYAITQKAHASNGPLRGEKAQLWEGGIRVPAFVMWKGKIKPGQVINYPLSNMDVAPTISAITGEKPMPAAFDGEDISAAIFNNKPVARTLYWQYLNTAAVRKGGWKLIYNKTTGTCELYNLANDLKESTNIATQYPEKVSELRSLLFTWMAKWKKP